MTGRTRQTLHERIRYGIAWLDAYGPKNWRNRITRAITKKRLDLKNPKHCILGEVYGDYFVGLRQLNLDGLDAGGPTAFNVLGSSNKSHDELTREYDELTREWARCYREGQAQANKSRSTSLQGVRRSPRKRAN